MKYLSRLMALLFVMAVVACGAAADTLPLNFTAGEYAADAQNAGKVLELYNSFMASTTVEEMYFDKLLPAHENNSYLLSLFTDEQIIAIGQLANTIFASVEDPEASVIYQGEVLEWTVAGLHEELMAALATVFGEYDWSVYAGIAVYFDAEGTGTQYTTFNSAIAKVPAGGTQTLYVKGAGSYTTHEHVEIKDGKRITICSMSPDDNKPVVSFTNNETALFEVHPKSSLTIGNITIQNTPNQANAPHQAIVHLVGGDFTLESYGHLRSSSFGVLVDNKNSTFTQNGGHIYDATGIDADDVPGSAVRVNAGEFVMNNGVIRNTEEYGIHQTGGTVEMTGTGSICQIYGASERCVTIEGGTFEMSGGQIFPIEKARTTDSIYNYGVDGSDRDENTLIDRMKTVYGEDIDTMAKGGVHVSGNGLFKMSGGEIFGFYDGRSVYVLGDASNTASSIENRRPAFHFSGGVLHSNYASDGPGVKVTNDNFLSATTYGGGAVIMSGGSIERNVAHNGGGVRVERNASFKMTDGSITKNVAMDHHKGTDGGSGGGGGVRLVGAEYIMSGGTISYNKAFGTNAAQKYNGGGIGAVWQGGANSGYGNVDTKLVISGGQIVNNWAYRNGGGIAATDKDNDHAGYTAGINVSITGGTIANNSTDDCGGGVYVGGNSTVRISGGTIRENEAAVNGGGVSIELGSLELGNSGGVITYNNAVHGGGVYMGSRGGTATLFTGAQVANNTATGSGGGVYFVGGGIEANLNLYGGEITNNTAAVNGGGVYADSANVNVGRTASTDMVTISTNTAGDGAGMYLKQATGSQYQINVVKGVIDNNTASGNGGGICIVDGTGIFLGANGATGGPQLSNNSAKNGAGLAVDGGSPIVYGGTFTSNSATTDGGAVYVNKGSVTMHNGAMASNTATNGNGGAIRIADGDFIMNNGTLSGNEASKNGGAAYVSGGNFTMYGGTLGGSEGAGNTALNGGAAYVVGGNFEMISGTMSYNTAVEKTTGAAEEGTEGHGGAVYAAKSGSAGGAVIIGVKDCSGAGTNHSVTHKTLTHPSVNNNEAEFGGGFAVNGGSVSFYCGSVLDNKTDSDGTGKNVYMKDGAIVHHLDEAVIGSKENHGMVSTGGTLTVHFKEDGTNQHFTVQLIYNANIEVATNFDVVWEGTAPNGYYLNLPYCPQQWQDHQDEKNLRFVGWTESELAIDSKTIRDEMDYMPVGAPTEIRDMTEGDNKNVMKFYAVWAPQSSSIHYAYVVDGVNIVPNWNYNGPAYYDYALNEQTVNIGEPTMSGYTFEKWILYAEYGTDYTDDDPDTNDVIISNWGSDAECVSEDVPKYIPTLYSEIDHGLISSDDSDVLTKDTLTTLQSFGDITLVAVFEPAFSGLTIEVTGSSALDENESYYFRVSGNAYDNKSHVTMYVSVIPGENGTGSTTIYNLPVGDYTITEMKDWSWRYAVSGIPSEINEDFSDRLLMTRTRSTTETNYINVAIPSITEGKKVTFTVERNESRWLDDNENTATKIQ